MFEKGRSVLKSNVQLLGLTSDEDSVVLPANIKYKPHLSHMKLCCQLRKVKSVTFIKTIYPHF